MWLYIALLGYACLAVVSILDKFILSNEKVRPVVFVFFSTVFLLPLTFSIPWFSPLPNFIEWLIIGIGALSFVVSLWTMYLAFLKSEVSHSGPFIGALMPLFVLVLSQVFFKEQIQNSQIFGIFLLSFGTLLIAVQKNQRSDEWKQGLNWAIVSALFFSFFYIASKQIYLIFGFNRGFVFLWGTIGFFGALLFFSKKVREVVFPHHGPFWKLTHHFVRKSASNKQVITIVSNKILSAVGVVLVQYAISLGSVTKVNALSGFQYGVLVILVAILSRFSPKVFREQYQKGEFKQEIAAVLIIAVGLYYLVK